MAVKLAYQERLHGTPQPPGMQVRPIIRAERHLASLAASGDLVRTAQRADAVLDTQALLDHLECK
jgi:hypothetical protein